MTLKLAVSRSQSSVLYGANFVLLQVLSPPETSKKQMAPPRPTVSAEASRRLTGGVHVQQTTVTPPCISPPPANMASVPPVYNNNVICSNNDDINDWTDSEWSDEDGHEEMQVSKISTIYFDCYMHSCLL